MGLALALFACTTTAIAERGNREQVRVLEAEELMFGGDAVAEGEERDAFRSEETPLGQFMRDRGQSMEYSFRSKRESWGPGNLQSAVTSATSGVQEQVVSAAEQTVQQAASVRRIADVAGLLVASTPREANECPGSPTPCSGNGACTLRHDARGWGGGARGGGSG